MNARVTALQREVTDDKLKRLYRLVEDGMTEMDDVLKDRLNSLKADRDRAKAALERAKSHSSQAIRIDPALLEQFGRSIRENITSGSIPFRKAYLQSLIDVIEVDDALMFPGLFAPTGLLGADLQSAVWLYLIWHIASPSSVIV